MLCYSAAAAVAEEKHLWLVADCLGTGKSQTQQTEREQESCLGAPIKRVHLVFAYE